METTGSNTQNNECSDNKGFRRRKIESSPTRFHIWKAPKPYQELKGSLHRCHPTACTMASSSSIKKLIMKQSTEQKTAQSLLTEHFSLCSWHHAASVMKSDCWYWLQRYKQCLLFLKLLPTFLFSPNFIPFFLSAFKFRWFFASSVTLTDLKGKFRGKKPTWEKLPPPQCSFWSYANFYWNLPLLWADVCGAEIISEWLLKKELTHVNVTAVWWTYEWLHKLPCLLSRDRPRGQK